MARYKDYQDWYDNGPGSEAFKRNMGRDNMDLRDPVFNMNKDSGLGTRMLVTPGAGLQPFPPCCDCNTRGLRCDNCHEEAICIDQVCETCPVIVQCEKDTIDGDPEVIIKDSFLVVGMEEIDNGWLLTYESEQETTKTRHFSDPQSLCEFISNRM
jgi:hypothetical protein